MRHADHRALCHAGQVIQCVFNFSRIHIQAAANDEVLAAPDDAHIALRVDHAHVAGDEEAISGELLRVFLRHAPVTGKHIRPFDLNAADLTRAKHLTVVARDAQTHPRQRKTHTATDAS